MTKTTQTAILENPMMLAIASAKNFGGHLFDIMYGTPERSQMTMYFGFALFALSMVMMNGAQPTVCPS